MYLFFNNSNTDTPTQETNLIDHKKLTQYEFNKEELKIIVDEYDHFDDNITHLENNQNFVNRYFAPIKEGSLRGSIFSLAAICFDTTSLSFPLALSYMGLIPGSILLFIMSYLSHWSLKILLYAGRKKKILNYRELIRNCIGDKMVLLADLNNFIFSIGAQTAYIVTISRFFLESVNSIYGWKETKFLKFFQMFFSMVFLQIPLSMMKNISKLQYLSMIGSFVLVYSLIVMMIQSTFYYSLGIKEGRSIEYFNNLNWNYLDTFSVFLFGFAPHNGMFLIYSEMKKPTLRRTTKVLNRAMILQSVLFTIIAYSGYFSLIKDVPTIFLSREPLKDFDPKDNLIITAKILFFFSLHGLCAINFNLLRGSISGILFKGKDITFHQNLYVISLMFIFSNLLAFYCDNVVTIIGIISGISVTFICYVFPILCHIYSNDLPISHDNNKISLAVMIIICVLGIMSTIKGFNDNFY